MSDDILNTAPGATAPAAPAAPSAPAAPTKPVAPVATPAAPTEPAAPAEPVAIAAPGSTGDAGLDLAVSFFLKAGIALDSPEVAEAAKGNFAYLEAKLAELGDKAPGAEQYLKLAKDGYDRIQSNEKAQYEARKKTVHDAVGGEDNWKNIQEFVKTNAEPEELAQVRTALSQGGIVAQAMAELLARQYATATGTVKEPGNPVTQQGTPPGAAPLTLAGYRQELDALVGRIGSHNLDGSPEYAAIRRKFAHVRA